MRSGGKYDTPFLALQFRFPFFRVRWLILARDQAIQIPFGRGCDEKLKQAQMLIRFSLETRPVAVYYGVPTTVYGWWLIAGCRQLTAASHTFLCRARDKTPAGAVPASENRKAARRRNYAPARPSSRAEWAQTGRRSENRKNPLHHPAPNTTICFLSEDMIHLFRFWFLLKMTGEPSDL